MFIFKMSNGLVKPDISIIEFFRKDAFTVFQNIEAQCSDEYRQQKENHLIPPLNFIQHLNYLGYYLQKMSRNSVKQ